APVALPSLTRSSTYSRCGPSPTPLLPSSFFSSAPGRHRALHSFPTRRSSDLLALTGPAVVAGLRYFLKNCVPELSRRMDENLARDRKSTRLNSSHVSISYAVFCLKKKKYTVIDTIGPDARSAVARATLDGQET